MKCQLKRNYCTERKDIAILADQIQQNTKKRKKEKKRALLQWRVIWHWPKFVNYNLEEQLRYCIYKHLRDDNIQGIWNDIFFKNRRYIKTPWWRNIANFQHFRSTKEHAESKENFWNGNKGKQWQNLLVFYLRVNLLIKLVALCNLWSN